MKKFYITTPIYYVNDKPHIGHAYTTIAADVLARWHRMKGEKVFFLTGTDEHGSKIAQAAEKNGCSSQEYADRLAAEFKSLWKVLNISNDDFIRTTEERHIRGVQAVFQKLFERGDIFKGFYEDWFCVPCESFWLESELVERKCPDCGRVVEKLKEESYFFKLSNYANRLLEYYEKNPGFLSPPHRAQEIVNFVRSGLRDLSVSRLKEKWGIPVPLNSQHIVYVWFDALLNYITAAGYKSGDESWDMGLKTEKPTTHNPQPTTVFDDVWPCDIHFVGKEIYRFHAVIWPAMLMALNLPLPKTVFAHGWWTVEGEKMSKSKGNIVNPVDVVKEYGVDSFRYFLLREIPFGSDGDFSMNALKKRYNTELANDLGNLFSRTLTLIEKNLGGVIKKLPEKISFDLNQSNIIDAYEKIAFDEVLDQLMKVVREANLFVESNAPWKLAKENPEKCEKVLSECIVVLGWLSAGFYPFMPEICEKMWSQLGQETNLKDVAWDIFQNPLNSKFYLGKKVKKEAALFPRKI